MLVWLVDTDEKAGYGIHVLTMPRFSFLGSKSETMEVSTI